MIFFFSSRRRHTRCLSDWSSDVCSSDLLGEDVFRTGVQAYVRAHRLSNATTADLWHHLSQASGQDIPRLVSAWTEQPGYPLVRVSQRCESGEAVVTLTQERFKLNDPDAPALAWNVPVILADAAA